MRRLPAVLATLFALVAAPGIRAQGRPAAPGATPSPLAAELDRRAAGAEADLIAWRRHLHAHPELSNREVETARFIAEKLRSFGLEPRTGVARTGVVALIEGGRPGPVVALRADMDGLPVREELDLPFASRAMGEFEGRPVPVMHACGHDAHMAILLTAARVLTEVRTQIPGAVKLIFQPAEEGAVAAEQPAGAEKMVQEGVLDDPKVDAIFGLHAWALLESGALGWRPGPFMAAADRFEIAVEGRQTHGSTPWQGIDPIVAAAQIVTALQTIVSRHVELVKEPAVVTVGQVEAGIRSNIIPDRARLVGTIRTFDEGMREAIHARVKQIAENVAASAGARAVVTIERGYPVTVNSPDLTARMGPTLERVAPGRTAELRKVTGAEDFSYFQRQVPGFFFFLGVTPPDRLARVETNHSPRFYVDEAALATGVRALLHLTADYLHGTAAPKRPR
ncbi:MAG TPA: amidohydrolase [Vicinamibacteria bacterium]|nr:amidohydrolase [Vicinamibacteria bacterium]